MMPPPSSHGRRSDVVDIDARARLRVVSTIVHRGVQSAIAIFQDRLSSTYHPPRFVEAVSIFDTVGIRGVAVVDAFCD